VNEPALFCDHPRRFEANRYVYPVLSRRAGGMSIGVNLNPDKVCNFHCIYCQVDRRDSPSPLTPLPQGERGKTKAFVDIGRLREELDDMVTLAASGQIFAQRQFAGTPEPLRRLNDIALSGDGEPTTFSNFADIAALCAEVRRRHGLDALKLVLITNATMFHREEVQRGLEILDANNGEIWAKLDAGTEEYYRQIAASSIPFRRILDNLILAARQRPIVIQTLFLRMHEQPPTPAELDAYCERLNEITAAGGQIKLVQIHTVARVPAESWVTSLGNDEVDAIVALVRRRTSLPVAGFYGYG
jgi:wyosine [tRNA(Phe)-imidazoG37] synthetase (radical SAM superfamily)